MYELDDLTPDMIENIWKNAPQELTVHFTKSCTTEAQSRNFNIPCKITYKFVRKRRMVGHNMFLGNVEVTITRCTLALKSGADVGGNGSGEKEAALPRGWETKMDRNGTVFYVDHNTKTTQWNPPTEPSYFHIVEAAIERDELEACRNAMNYTCTWSNVELIKIKSNTNFTTHVFQFLQRRPEFALRLATTRDLDYRRYEPIDPPDWASWPSIVYPSWEGREAFQYRMNNKHRVSSLFSNHLWLKYVADDPADNPARSAVNDCLLSVF